MMDQQNGPWGTKVTIVEIKDMEIPEAMQRAIASGQSRTRTPRQGDQRCWRGRGRPGADQR
jgi:regulator of protease activity HflC (stomatin/prohibitin superfamily)